MQKEVGAKDLSELKAEAFGQIRLGFDPAQAKPSFIPAVPCGIETANAEFPLYMVTGILMQHSGSLSTLSKSLDSVVADAYVQMSPADAKKYSLEDDRFVKVISPRGEIYLKAKVSDEVPEGMLFVPAHFPHARVSSLTIPPDRGGCHSMVAVRVEPA